MVPTGQSNSCPHLPRKGLVLLEPRDIATIFLFRPRMRPSTTVDEAAAIVAGITYWTLQNMNIFQSAQPSLLDRAWRAIRYPYDLVRNPLDALLSIPAVSFLLVPTFSSYATSLNLLFFYVTWSTLILSNSPLKVEVLGTLGIRILFYLLPATAFLVFDSATPNIAAKAKEHGEVALPMSEEQGGRKGRWWRTALVSAGNVLLGVVLQLGMELGFTKLLHVRSALKISTTLPLPWAIVIDLIRGLFLREVSSYPPFSQPLRHADFRFRS